MPLDRLTAEPTELLRTMIRNACVNDDTVGSGQEIRNVQALRTTAGSGPRVGGSRPHPPQASSRASRADRGPTLL
jgi:hypothetical protein